MSRWTVPPGCVSIKMKSDGKEYPVDRRGNVHVDDHYDAEMKRSAHNKYGYANPGVIVQDMHKGSGKVCVKCNFVAFSFSKTCPKCKSDEFKPEE